MTIILREHGQTTARRGLDGQVVKVMPWKTRFKLLSGAQHKHACATTGIPKTQLPPLPVKTIPSPSPRTGSRARPLSSPTTMTTTRRRRAPRARPRRGPCAASSAPHGAALTGSAARAPPRSRTPCRRPRSGPPPLDGILLVRLHDDLVVGVEARPRARPSLQPPLSLNHARASPGRGAAPPLCAARLLGLPRSASATWRRLNATPAGRAPQKSASFLTCDSYARRASVRHAASLSTRLLLSGRRPRRRPPP